MRILGERVTDEAPSAADAEGRVAGAAKKGHAVPGVLARVRWTAPLVLGGGVRLALFAVGALGARMLHGAHRAGPLAIWEQWDANQYVRIAAHGYTYSPYKGSGANFFPLFPLAIWFLQPVTRLFVAGASSYALAGMVIAWATFLAACVALYRLALDRFGAAAARGSVLLLAVFPFSFYFGAPFSESPYLLFTVLAFLGCERGRWWWACAAAMAAGATRPPGFIVGVCVVLAYALDWLRTRHPVRRDVLALALTPLGTSAYMLYCWVRWGDPLAFQKTSWAGWHGGHPQAGGLLMARDYLLNLPAILTSHDFRHLLYAIYALLLLLFLLSVVPVARLLGAPYALFASVSIVLPVVTFPSINSTGRYLSVVFPSFVLLAYLLRHRPNAREVVVATSAAFLGLLTLFFASGYPMA